MNIFWTAFFVVFSVFRSFPVVVASTNFYALFVGCTGFNYLIFGSVKACCCFYNFDNELFFTFSCPKRRGWRLLGGQELIGTEAKCATSCSNASVTDIVSARDTHSARMRRVVQAAPPGKRPVS